MFPPNEKILFEINLNKVWTKWLILINKKKINESNVKKNWKYTKWPREKKRSREF